MMSLENDGGARWADSEHERGLLTPEVATGLHWQIRKDNSPYRKALFHNFVEKSPLVAHGYDLIAKRSRGELGAWCCWLFFVHSFLSIRLPRPTGVVTAFRTRNERETFLKVISTENRSRVGVVEYQELAGLRGREAVSVLVKIRRLAPLRRLMKELSLKYPLFVALRATEYLAYCAKLDDHIGDERVRTVLVFSDGNPHGIALLHLARSYGKGAVFVAHGEPTEPIYPLLCSAAFLWGQSSAERYREAGARFERTVLLGCRDKWLPMDRVREPLSCVGIFLSKMTRKSKIVSLVGRIRQVYDPETILIRPHPNAPLPLSMEGELTSLPGVRISEGSDLSTDARASDLVLAGNTTAHPEILLGGTPSLYCFDLEGADFDRIGYVRQNLVLAWTPQISIPEINDFYRPAEVQRQLRCHFDLDRTSEASFRLINEIIFQT